MEEYDRAKNERELHADVRRWEKRLVTDTNYLDDEFVLAYAKVDAKKIINEPNEWLNPIVHIEKNPELRQYLEDHLPKALTLAENYRRVFILAEQFLVKEPLYSTERLREELLLQKIKQDIEMKLLMDAQLQELSKRFAHLLSAEELKQIIFQRLEKEDEPNVSQRNGTQKGVSRSTNGHT